jgi:hypothetical protein
MQRYSKLYPVLPLSSVSNKNRSTPLTIQPLHLVSINKIEGKSMMYKKKDIERIKENLASLPKIADEEKEVSKPEAIRLLADEIVSLTKKGYSLEAVAKALTENGLKTTGKSLKTYLAGIKPVKRANSVPRKNRLSGNDGSESPMPSREKIRSAEADKKSAFVPRPDSQEI